MTTSEAGVRGLKPTPEMGGGFSHLTNWPLFPWVLKCPSPILYWDSRKSETVHCARVEVPGAHIPSVLALPHLP